MTNDPAPVGDGRDPRWRLSPTKIVVAVILLVAIVVPLLVGTYARVEPRLFGFPFFYWYQLLWVFLGAGITGAVYAATTREEAPPVESGTLGDRLGTRRGLYRRGGAR